MPRQKATNRVPPIGRSGRAGSAWDSVFLGNKSSVSPSEETPDSRRSYFDLGAAKIQAEQRADPTLYEEIEMARNGDDSELLTYQPTATINPKRPRTLAAGYDERTQSLRVKFRDGEYYTYYNVPPSVWYRFTRASSPGRYINSSLNNFPYSRGLS